MINEYHYIHKKIIIILLVNFNIFTVNDDISNMLTQETQSVACVLRIVLKAICDESRRVHWEHAQNVASNVINDSLQYYLSLNNHYHQTSWNTILLLIFTKLYKLPEDKVQKIFSIIL